MVESSQKGKETLWEKEKLLVTSNFSLSHGVFQILVPQTLTNQGLFVKGLNNKCYKMFFAYCINQGQTIKRRDKEKSMSYLLFYNEQCSL